jgi:SAP domain.
MSLLKKLLTTLTPQRKSLDWKDSAAHLMALEQFLCAKRADVGLPDYWESALNSPPKYIIEQFIKDGLLIPLSLVESIQSHFKLSEMKEQAKSLGLAVSGKKEDLAKRLANENQNEMTRFFDEYPVLICSEEAKRAVETYRKDKEKSFEKTITSIKLSLNDGNFMDAVITAREYRKNEIKIQPPNSLAIKTPQPSVKDDIQHIECIFKIRPKILKELDYDDWKPLSVVVAMGYLLGVMPTTWLPESFKGLTKFGNAVTLKMMNFHLNHLSRMKKLRSLGIKKVKIMGGCECDACKQLSGKTFLIENAPELPYEQCNHYQGCRCLIRMEKDIFS